jgi:predicted metal-dependent phosphoesterase TrpH
LIDLHTHTDCSDGSTDPGELVRLALHSGIEALGISDHDTFAGYDAALPVAQAAGLEVICAVELSTRPDEPAIPGKRARSVHVLGYWLLEPPSPEFRHFLVSQQNSRRQRNVDLVAKLNSLGVDITLQDAEVHGRNQVGRPHFARVLLEKGYVKTIQQAFDVYLADEARASVDREEPTTEEGIRRIVESGGLASLAHPVRLPQSGEALATLLQRLVAAGLQGIEVFHSEQSAENSLTYGELARRFNLIQTGGSDFHGDNKPGIFLGTGLIKNLDLPYSFLETMRESFAKRK